MCSPELAPNLRTRGGHARRGSSSYGRRRYPPHPVHRFAPKALRSPHRGQAGILIPRPSAVRSALPSAACAPAWPTHRLGRAGTGRPGDYEGGGEPHRGRDHLTPPGTALSSNKGQLHSGQSMRRVRRGPTVVTSWMVLLHSRGRYRRAHARSVTRAGQFRAIHLVSVRAARVTVPSLSPRCDFGPARAAA
jgi:hypothetical protein